MNVQLPPLSGGAFRAVPAARPPTPVPAQPSVAVGLTINVPIANALRQAVLASAQYGSPTTPMLPRGVAHPQSFLPVI